jgi:predicted transcriptional regulator
MTVAEVAKLIGGAVVASAADADRTVTGGYVSDLLSDVIANAHEGDVWITLQKHVNIVAVGRLNALAGIVIVNGRQPEPEAIQRAAEEHVPIVSTPLSAFNVVGTLFGLGVRARG